MKKRFLAFLSHMWWVYLMIFIASFGTGYGIYAVLSLPNANEMISLFIGASYVDEESLQMAFMAYYEGTEIKEVSVDHSDPSSVYYASVFQTRGLVNTDALILASDSISDFNYPRYFAPLSDEIVSEYVARDNATYASYGGADYGIAIDMESYGEKISFVSGLDYFLFFNKKSSRIGALNGSENDLALRLIQGIAS